MKQKETIHPYILVALVMLLVLVVSVNTYALTSLADSLGLKKYSSGQKLGEIDLEKIANTGQSVVTLFPIEDIKTQQDAIEILIPAGEPEYANSLPISYDDPVASLNYLEKYYPVIKAELKKDPKLWQRYLNLASKPVGISCEFCCGIGPVGISKNGELSCGCSHNPAIHALTMWLIKNTDYTDAEVLKEALKWKTLWFPKNMIELGMKASGGQIDMNALPEMVGGC